MSGKLRSLEKRPNQMMYVDKILRVVPEALFVELVRDPRDVLASKSIRSTREWQERLRPEQREAWRSSAFDPLWDTVGWQSAIRAGDEARKRHPERVYRVKYEDLVANAAEETDKICDFLGLEFNAEMLDVYVTNTTTQGDPQRRGIRREAVGKWQRTLAPEAVALCQWVAKREMDRLGYPRVPVSRTTYAKTPVLMVKSGVEFVSRLYRRWRLRGTGYVRNALSSYCATPPGPDKGSRRR